MAKSSTRSTGSSGGKSVFTGVLIGLIVGAILAVGVALWITRSNPFKPAAPAPEKAPHAPAPRAQAAPETAPSFDFYKVLPSDNAPAEMPPAPQPASSTPLYYLQAGAFQNPADADNLKAQLALLGVEAAIQTRDLGDKGIFHRVRIGPFNAMGAINQTRKLLAQNNIPATLVKEVPNSQETP